MWTYSLIWMNRNVAPSRNVVSIPAFSPNRLPFLIDVWAQCIVNDEDTRIAVLKPATRTGSLLPLNGNQWSPWTRADEEVGGEERAEDHHLGDDEKEHPEHLRLDARAAVRGRGAVVLVVVVGEGGAGGFHQAPPQCAPAGAPGRSATTCSTGRPAERRRRSIRLARSQPERVPPASRRRCRRRGRTAARSSWRCRGRGRRPSRRRAGPTSAGGRGSVPGARGRRLAAAPPPPSWGTITMNRCRSSDALAFSASASGSLAAVRLATTSVTANGRPSFSRSTTMCSTGSPEAACTRSTRSRRIQPEVG